LLRLQTEGEAPNRIQKNDAVQVLEVRQGNVLSYLQAGDYTGEGCFLEDSNGIYRFETTTTAMVDSDLCYLLKADLAEVKEEFPEVETSIQTVMNQKAMLERPRRMFGEAAGGDGSLSPLEVRELLISQLHFSEGPELDDLITTMAKGGGVVDEFEFAAWFRAHEAAEQEQYRKDTVIREKVMAMGLCPAGFDWHREGCGWRCNGGSHFVSNDQLPEELD
jgi:hypothetical protein